MEVVSGDVVGSSVKMDVMADDDILYVLDDKQITAKQSKGIEAGLIKSVSVLKKGGDAAKEPYVTSDKTVLIIKTTAP